MELVGFECMIVPSNKEEIITKEAPEEVVTELALMKARDVADKVKEPGIIIGADTIVAHKNKILGKPKDGEDAKWMIKELQDDIHQVFTGVAIITPLKEIHFVVETKVAVNPMSDKEISDYVASGEPLDKAGAYGIQGRFALFIKEIIGDYYNVMGLPISKIYEMLLKEGLYDTQRK
ncbi:septum formation protein [Mobilisporobacter senegalensis]|uniref:Nucleoside triphosphate pyrophosphatase n=2 Tax=Mobilisporobacter senegalensis TaxID=1329262 RepID=A0A3N1XVB2_9FIRM|nr:septum formation protein [Mobilisporobacter senegalensis]